MTMFNTVNCNEVIETSDGLGCSFACCDEELQGRLQILKDNSTEINKTTITNELNELEASTTTGMDSNQQFICRATSEICPMHTIPSMCTVAGSVLKLKCILVDSSTCSHTQV